jgi:hypothetical protein
LILQPIGLATRAYRLLPAPASPDFFSWVIAAGADRDLLVPRLTGPLGLGLRQLATISAALSVVVVAAVSETATAAEATAIAGATSAAEATAIAGATSAAETAAEVGAAVTGCRAAVTGCRTAVARA